MKIAICSDSTATAVQLEYWLNQYCDLYRVFLTVDHFSRTPEFNDAARLCRYDALFLCADGPEGFLLVRGVRERNTELKIIFITDTEAYAVSGFRLHLTDYIVKPLGFPQVTRAMRLLGIGV